MAPGGTNIQRYTAILPSPDNGESQWLSSATPPQDGPLPTAA
jgi:hypothetical protein